VAARVLQNSLAQMTLLRQDDRTKALHGIVSDLLSMDEPRKRFGAMMAGLDIRYDFGEGHPALGRRMPDLDLMTACGPSRVYEFLHRARPVLLDFGASGSADITGWEDRVQLVHAEAVGGWDIPVLGAVSAPAAVLIRPDGHIAWVADGYAGTLRDALVRWCGAPDVPVG
jgi:3-(3-hydroxy-phenyl)propionate hydroxylase